MNDARMTPAVMDELPECVRKMIGIIPVGEGDSVEDMPSAFDREG